MAKYSVTTEYQAAPTGNLLVANGARTTNYQVDSATFLAAQQSLAAGAGRAVSLDGTHGLPTPTGSGLEFVIGADGLDDIRHNGVSL